MAQKQPSRKLKSKKHATYQSTLNNNEEWQIADYENLKEPKKSSFFKYFLYAIVAFAACLGVSFLMLSLEPSVIKVPRLIKVSELAHQHIPSHKKGNRLIIVGDVHGSNDQLQDLLKKAKYNKKHDHILLLGDFISKGNQNLEVLEFAISTGASCIRGNHEQDLLIRYSDFHKLPRPKTLPLWRATGVPPKTPDDEYTPDIDIVKQLTPDHIRYISSCPLIMDLHNITGKGTNKAVAVHAGLMWNEPRLEKQDEEACLSMRTLLPPSYTEFSEESEGVSWYDIWNDKQQEDPANSITVFYGHIARDGLTVKPYTIGLDSGCVKGKKLSAAIVSTTATGEYTYEIVQVSCKSLKKKKE